MEQATGMPPPDARLPERAGDCAVDRVVNLQIATACLHEAAQKLARVVRARPPEHSPAWQQQLRATLAFYQRARTQFAAAEGQLTGESPDARSRAA